MSNSNWPDLPLSPLLLAAGLALGVLGCGSGPGKQINEQIGATRRHTKPADVRAALTPFFSYDGIRYENDATALTNPLPKEITTLPIFSDYQIHVEVNRVHRENVLMLTVGSGFGHWGIVVLRPGYEEDFRDSRYTHWGDGVYFFSDFK